MKCFLLLLTLLTLSTGALADCTYNGKTYPTGTVIGPYVCSGTQWK